MFGFGGRVGGVLAVACCLAACGGGGGSGSSAPPPITIPTPSPTVAPPTPAPPTPVPSIPTPSPAYGTVFDFSRDQSFDSPVAQVRISERYNPNVPRFYEFESAQGSLLQDPRAARIDYRAEAKSLTIAMGAELTVLPAETLVDRTADILRYGRSTPETVTFRLVRSAPDFRYVSISHMLFYGSVLDSGPTVRFDIERYFLLGIPTLASDLPTSGTGVYSAQISTSTVTFDGGVGLGGTGTLNYDFTSRQITGSLLANQVGWITGTTPVRATLNFSGSESGGYVRGRISSPDSAYAGEFIGRLFGPAGTELGLVFTITRDGKSSAGQLVAKKN